MKTDCLIDSMVLTDRMHRHILDSYAKQLGITHSAHFILLYLDRGKSPSQKEIADSLEITPAAVTGILKKLESAGLITRKAGSDLRNNEIAISEKGKEFLKEKRRAFREIDRQLFDGFTDEEADVYLRCLSKMQNNMAQIKKAEEKEEI